MVRKLIFITQAQRSIVITDKVDFCSVHWRPMEIIKIIEKCIESNTALTQLHEMPKYFSSRKMKLRR